MRRRLPARFRTASIALALTAAAALISGCFSLESARGAEGLLDALVSPISPAQAAEWAVDPYDPNNRYRGTLLLANAPFAGESVYIRLFEANITDEDASVRTASARGLANHGTPEHVPLLVKSLTDTDRYVRLESARGLQRLHNPAAIDGLVAALDERKEPETEVRAEAAHALGQYPANRVVDALIRALDDRSLAVNRNALAALRTLTGQNLGLDTRAWLAWQKGNTDPFASRQTYVYPVFKRDKFFWEYLPFVPRPPNEVATPPAGLPAQGG